MAEKQKEAAGGKPTILIIKKHKKGHGGAHGGSWKVAYADFVTAMMAFFLLMWLISILDPVKRKQVSDYINNYSLLMDKGGASMIATKDNIPDKSLVEAEKLRSAKDMSRKMAEQIKNKVEEKLQALKEHIAVSVVDKKIVRIDIFDKEGDPIFQSGSAEILPNGKKIIAELAPNLKEMAKNLTIEGHTDSIAYKGSKFTNWELSTQRASSARIELDGAGIDPNMVFMVAGFAATKPLIKDNPEDPRNRRISFVVDFSQENPNLKEIEAPSAKKEGGPAQIF